MLFSVNLLKRQSFATSPPNAPQAFFCTIAKFGPEPVPTVIHELTELTDATYREGQLAATSHVFYASPTVFPEVYVNMFGVGAPLAALGCRYTPCSTCSSISNTTVSGGGTAPPSWPPC